MHGVYNGYLPCCLDKMISIYSPSISTLIKHLTHEPLHDFMDCIKDLFEELLLHLPKEIKGCVTSSILILMQKKLRTTQITEEVSYMSPLG